MITQENIPYTADEIKAMVKTIEELRKKYNDALERAVKLAIDGYLDAIAIDDIFPELKEGENKRIKREILELVSIAGNGNQFEEIKDWLEKQGEQPTDKIVDDAYLQGVCDAKHEIEKQGKKVDADKVIAWLVANIVDFEYCVKLFKKDFKL